MRDCVPRTKNNKQGFETARQTPLVTYSTVVVEGAGRLQAPSPGEVGFNYEGKWLTGKAMLKQMQAWATKGTLEQSAVDNLTKVVEAGDAWTNLRDSYFVVMGAGAAMSPTECLLRLGANVIAVDIDIPAVYVLCRCCAGAVSVLCRCCDVALSPQLSRDVQPCSCILAIE